MRPTFHSPGFTTERYAAGIGDGIDPAPAIRRNGNSRPAIGEQPRPRSSKKSPGALRAIVELGLISDGDRWDSACWPRIRTLRAESRSAESIFESQLEILGISLPEQGLRPGERLPVRNLRADRPLFGVPEFHVSFQPFIALGVVSIGPVRLLNFGLI